MGKKRKAEGATTLPRTFRLEIARGSAGEDRIQSVDYLCKDAADTVATALTQLCEDTAAADIHGEPTGQIFWESSCLQKKCGACAMRINGRPRLACDAKLCELEADVIRLEPLAKFPRVRDLLVDRDILRENLRILRVWLQEEASAGDDAFTYEASRCLQCGICLEVCPNFYAGGDFFGTAGLVPTARLLSELPEVQKSEVREQYRKHIYEGCGKSLACRDVCPAGIDIEELLVRSNALAVWRRKEKRRKRS